MTTETIPGRAFSISCSLENALVARNLRGMQTLQAQLQPGYLYRAARRLMEAGPRILIATGFPVLDSYESDGPVGALALYAVCVSLGKRPLLVCEARLAQALPSAIEVLQLDTRASPSQLLKRLQEHAPDLLVSIERPGLAADQRYYNMHGEDISDRVARLDACLPQLGCACIAIGDGGNELGMGKLGAALAPLAITPSVTHCEELLIADVSNWGVYGLIAMLGWLTQTDLLAALQPESVLQQLCERGIVDGISRLPEPTEDGRPAADGLQLIEQLRRLIGFAE